MCKFALNAGQQGKSTGLDSCDRPKNLIQIGLKSSISFAPMNLKLDGRRRRTTWYLFSTMQAVGNISKPLVNSNLKYSPKTPNSGQNLRFYFVRVSLKFDGWHWKTIEHVFYSTSNFVYHFVAISGFKPVTDRKFSIRVKVIPFFVLCGLEIWQIIMKNERAPPLSYFQLCAWLHNHPRIKPRLTVQKRSIRFKSAINSLMWSWNFIDDLEKRIGHFFCWCHVLCTIS